MTDYKSLNLNREMLDRNIQHFGTEHNYGIQITKNEKSWRINVIQPGHECATVDLHLVDNGVTTISWKLGKNRELGEKFAIFLKNTIDPGEFETVNCVIKGIVEDSISPIFGLLSDCGEFTLKTTESDNKSVVVLKSNAHQDQLTITHHKTTSTLQIQGKPLSCYRRLTYLLTDLLDMKGLERVILRRDDTQAVVVKPEAAAEYLREKLPNSYDALPANIKKLLVSSSCIKLAKPDLPDYSLLVYPELRALEASIRDVLYQHGFEVSQSDKAFGAFFEQSNKIHILKSDVCATIRNQELIRAFNQGYSFYRKHRHRLFHMDDTPYTSRMINTLELATDLAEDIFPVIDCLYTRRP